MAFSRRQAMKALAAAAVMSPTLGQTQPAAQARIRLVILDVGGTLIEDHGEVPDSMRSAFLGGGVDISLAEIGEWRGASKRGMVRHFVELRREAGPQREALIDRIYADFSRRANEAYQDVQPIKGAEDALKRLRQTDLLLATSTGFDRPLNDFVFRHFDWHKYFAATITSDDVVDGRPSPFMIFHAMEATHVDRVAEVVAVGDTPLDLQAASNAQVRGVIGVSSGAATAERLSREPHTHLLRSVAELPDLLRAEFGVLFS
jgi:phosphonatase-like hydrolase